MTKIILASKSFDRGKIFKRLGIPFETFITDIDEEKYKMTITNPFKLVKELAKTKALSAKEFQLKKNADAIIIAADTIIEFNGEIIGKANDENEAFVILKKLSGKVHNLITGIAICQTNDPKVFIDSDLTTVEFLKLSNEEIWRYIKTKEWVGRAGAYSIRDKASLFIIRIHGSSSNVIGLPMHKLYNILKNEFGFDLIQLN